MKYLLDTCVISELVKPQPAPGVVNWIQNQQEQELYLSVLTCGELQKGIEKLVPSQRQRHLLNWLENDLKQRFHNRLLEIDLKVASCWGSLVADAEKAGRPLATIDSLLAATAKAHQLTLATRNTKDFEASQVPLLNPWTASNHF